MSPQLTLPSRPRYRPDIDGLRAVAVLAVVIFHAFPGVIRGGFIGVDIFFVISGYLISTIIFEKLDEGNFSFFEFYARRIRRIFPALLVVLIFASILGWFTLLAHEYKQLGLHIAAGAGFLSNFVLWSEVSYFDNAADTKPLLHLWSLGIEEQFYIIWPFSLWCAWRFKLNIFKFIIAVTTISFVLNLIGIEKYSTATFYMPPTRFWELSCGSILAWLLVYKNNEIQNVIQKINISNKNRASNKFEIFLNLNTLSFSGFFLLMYGFWGINKTMNFPGYWAIIPVLGASCIIFAGEKAWINREILSNKILVQLGLISFPLYLWHWPLLSFAKAIENEDLNKFMRMAILLLATILAWMTFKFVEHYFRLKLNQRKSVIKLTVYMVLIGCIGFGIFSYDGLKFRSAAHSFLRTREIQKIEEFRLRLIKIRSGICQFNQQGRYNKISDFIANWRCLSDDENMINSRALVFGDSHSADKAMGLRLNGVDVVQLGGAGCSVNPALATGERNNCSFLFNVIKKFENNYDYIILSNYFDKQEISNENISQILKYWSSDKKVYLFTPMPDFSNQMKNYLKKGIITDLPDFFREDAFLQVISKVTLPSNFVIIKTSDIWCVNRQPAPDHPCAYAVNGQQLMTDGGHLSVAGAKIFGKNMLAHPALARLSSQQ